VHEEDDRDHFESVRDVLEFVSMFVGRDEQQQRRRAAPISAPAIRWEAMTVACSRLGRSATMAAIGIQ
jgi:hypothetical protein